MKPLPPVCPNCGNMFGWWDTVVTEGLLPYMWHHHDCDNPEQAAMPVEDGQSPLPEGPW